jgi:hypothetical protein
MQKPYFVCHSLSPKVIKETGHQNGGMALVCDPSIIDQVTLIDNGDYTLVFKYGSIVIAAVYWPPSLQSVSAVSQQQGISKEFVKIKKTLVTVDVILGDFNFRLGSRNNDSKTILIDRYNEMCQYLPEYTRIGMNLKESIWKSSNNDHLFLHSKYCESSLVVESGPSIQVDWSYQKGLEGIQSDHGMIVAKFTFSRFANPSTKRSK